MISRTGSSDNTGPEMLIA